MARARGRQAPLVVEIGFGNGEFLVREAQAHPECSFIGIEPGWASVQRGLRRIAQARLPNVRLLLVDAHIALERLFTPQTVQRVYALLPCPWPKERHSKHRLFTQTFLTLLNSRLVPDGEAQMVTDSEPYLHWVLAQISRALWPTEGPLRRASAPNTSANGVRLASKNFTICACGRRPISLDH